MTTGCPRRRSVAVPRVAQEPGGGALQGSFQGAGRGQLGMVITYPTAPRSGAMGPSIVPQRARHGLGTRRHFGTQAVDLVKGVDARAVRAPQVQVSRKVLVVIFDGIDKTDAGQGQRTALQRALG